MCGRCFLCVLNEFCAECHKCPTCCSKSSCRSQIPPIWGIMGNPGGQSKGHKNPQRRLHPPLLDPTKFDKITNHHKWLCTSSQEQLSGRGISCGRIGQHSESWSLSPWGKASTKIISPLPLSLHGSNRLWSYAMSSLMRRYSHYIRLKPMMWGPLQLLRLSSQEFQ